MEMLEIGEVDDLAATENAIITSNIKKWTRNIVLHYLPKDYVESGDISSSCIVIFIPSAEPFEEYYQLRTFLTDALYGQVQYVELEVDRARWFEFVETVNNLKENDLLDIHTMSEIKRALSHRNIDWNPEKAPLLDLRMKEMLDVSFVTRRIGIEG